MLMNRRLWHSRAYAFNKRRFGEEYPKCDTLRVEGPAEDGDCIDFIPMILGDRYLKRLYMTKGFMNPIRLCMSCWSIASNTSIVSLHLEANGIDEYGVSALKVILTEGTHIKELYLRHNTLGSDGVTQLARECLATNHTLEVLDLSDNAIDGQGIEKLVQVLEYHPKLKYLGLAGNDLPGQGSLAVSSYLTRDTPLESLDIADCHLNLEDIENLGRALKSNAHLQFINLKNNHFFDDRFVAGMVNNHTLRSIKISPSCLLIPVSFRMDSLIDTINKRRWNTVRCQREVFLRGTHDPQNPLSIFQRDLTVVKYIFSLLYVPLNITLSKH